MSKNNKNANYNTVKHNEAAWDEQATSQKTWSQSVSSEIINNAKNGHWQIHITKKPLPTSWLPQNIKNKKILCLASGGGQQAPVLAAAGANVTVLDISEKQLDLDRFVAHRDNLNLTTIQGDMSDLSEFQNDAFDYIIHPISNLYVADLKPVWQECFRSLRSGGKLISSFYNPVLFIFAKDNLLADKGLLRPQHRLPFAEINDLNQKALDKKIENNEALIYGHTLSSQIGGQIEAGLLIAGFYEDEHPFPRFLIEQYMDTMIATYAIKP
jgi:SAM-dependent methyltransferase